MSKEVTKTSSGPQKHRKKKPGTSVSPEDFEFVALAGRGGFGNVRLIFCIHLK